MSHWENDLAETLSLDGEWQFALGEQHGPIQIPGAWEAQGYARRADGPAEFRKQIAIPGEWRGRHIQLQFDALSYYVEADVNGIAVGSHIGLWTPFACDVTAAIRPGEENEIRLTVFKPGERFPIRESLAGFLPDVALIFGGIWQSAWLVALPDAALSDITILAQAESGDVQVAANAHRAEGLVAVITITDPDGIEVAVWREVVDSPTIAAHLNVASPQLWQPDKPVLYHVEIRLEDERGVRALAHRSFGFRALTQEGEQLLFNGLPICLRGVMNWGWYPEKLCPAPDEVTIRDEFRRVRELGFNMVKLCLVVPSPLYFEIADQEGMLLWLELPLWLPKITPALKAQAPQEYADIVAHVHHHPSIVIYSLGCELNKDADAEFLGQLNAAVRGGTGGVLVCDNSGSGEAYGGLAFDYADFNDYHFYCDLHYFDPLIHHFRRDWRPARPWIFGEFCDADDYRNLSEIAAAYDGKLPWWLTEQNPLHPLSFIAYTEQPTRMAARNLSFDEQALQRISRQQSFVMRKTILEKVRKHAGMGGYVVTGLRDTPIATSAVLDDLARPKYAVEDFREFNADSMLLLEQGRARTWKHGGDRPAPLDLHNHEGGSELNFRLLLAHSGAEIAGGELHWQLLHPNEDLYDESFIEVTGPLPGGIPHEIAPIRFTAPQVEQAQEFTLIAEFNGQTRNHWPLWIYPPVTAWPSNLAFYDPAGCLDGLDDLLAHARNLKHERDFDSLDQHVLVTSVLTPAVEAYVRQGGHALVMQVGVGGLAAVPCPFWREGIKLLHSHPALDDFPHRGYADLQFYHLATDYALDMTQVQTDLRDIEEVRPMLRRLDARQFTVHDYLVEFRLGAGKVVASTLRFGGGAGDQVSGLKRNVAGRFLLYRMLAYLSSSR